MGKSRTRQGAPMDKPPEVIVKFETPTYGVVVIETSNRLRYHSDLNSLSETYCYPKNLEQWKKASIDSFGLALVWQSRFEAHIDQIIGLASKTESLARVKKHAG